MSRSNFTYKVCVRQQSLYVRGKSFSVRTSNLNMEASGLGYILNLRKFVLC